MNNYQTYTPTWKIRELQDILDPTDKAQTTNSVIHWQCNIWGHTEYVDVKVTHWGSLKTESEIVDSTWVVINPATEEKQNTNNDLVDALYMLVKSLAFLPSVRDTTAWLRTSIQNTPNIGTVTTVTTTTTVGTLSNQTNAGGYAMNSHIPSLINQTATNNIRNIIIS